MYKSLKGFIEDVRTNGWESTKQWLRKYEATIEGVRMFV